MNPLLQKSTYPLEAIDFTQIKEEHYLPALKQAISEARANFELIKNTKEINFKNIIHAGEIATDNLDQVVEIFYALHSAHCTDGISEIAEEFDKELTGFSSDINLDSKLFSQIKELFRKKETLNLTTEEMTVLEKSYKDFSRNGALLDPKQKEILREIDQKIAKLSLDFSENIRKASNEYLLIVDSLTDLKGLADGSIEAAAMTAKEKGHEGKWCFTLDYPSYVPFLQSCEKRSLREELWKAKSSLATAGKYNNQSNILLSLSLKQERAQLLGYPDFPSFVLEKRMAQNTNTVFKFIDEIQTKALPKAKKEIAKLIELKKELTGVDDFKKYDTAFYSEILKKRELDFDDEELRPFFKLENVLKGIFEVANRLYGLKFIEREDIPKYHPDVRVYEVKGEDDEYIGLFYGDYFPRPEKRPGAWMTTFRSGGFQFGEVKRPFVCNVCNFTKPTDSRPSLLSFDEVSTLFHEFGHGLHGLLTKSKYRSVAGTNVFWDFVELPSQIMENWCFEKECLDLFAKHFETGKLIPEELVAKIKKGQKFLEAISTIRQLSFSKMDMKWHMVDPQSVEDVETFEKMALEEFELLPVEQNTIMSCSFSHIFSGGYSAGYYSYKWAEVLDADAFEFFKENGIFNKKIAKSFRENILEKGGTELPMEMYKKFRGHAPDTQALLKRGGLV